MPTYRTKVGPNGQVTLPAELAEKLAIREGVEVEFFLAPDGDVFFHAITGMAAGWKDLFPTEKRSPPISVREMDEGIAEHIIEDYERIRRQDQNAPAQRESGRSAAE